MALHIQKLRKMNEEVHTHTLKIPLCLPARSASMHAGTARELGATALNTVEEVI